MATVNENFLKLQAGYLFPEVGKRRRAYQQAHPEAKIISMGIGDVTQPLAPAVIEAMHKAVDEMAKKETFRGYDDGGVGYEFLREAIRANDYASRGLAIGIEEIFISDGAKSDTANSQELFGLDNVVAVTDPVYPVYVDSNVMAGRTGPMTGRECIKKSSTCRRKWRTILSRIRRAKERISFISAFPTILQEP